MKTIIFLSLLLIGSFAANSQNILPENPDNLVAMVISSSSNGMQNEWSVNSDKHQFSDIFPSPNHSTDLLVVTTSQCKCHITVTTHHGSTDMILILHECPGTVSDEDNCKKDCDKAVDVHGQVSAVLNSYDCEE